MSTSRKQIENWLLASHDGNASHVLIVQDRFTEEEFPITLYKPNKDERLHHFVENPACKVLEVYNLELDWDYQLNTKRRAYYPDDAEVYTYVPKQTLGSLIKPKRIPVGENVLIKATVVAIHTGHGLCYEVELDRDHSQYGSSPSTVAVDPDTVAQLGWEIPAPSQDDEAMTVPCSCKEHFSKAHAQLYAQLAADPPGDTDILRFISVHRQKREAEIMDAIAQIAELTPDGYRLGRVLKESKTPETTRYVVVFTKETS